MRAPTTASATDGIAVLVAVRDALATDAGARLAREIRALLARAEETEADSADTYAARLVARTAARAEGRVVRRILDHLHIPPVIPPRARPPPQDHLPGIDPVYDPCVDPPAAD